MSVEDLASRSSVVFETRYSLQHANFRRHVARSGPCHCSGNLGHFVSIWPTITCL